MIRKISLLMTALLVAACSFAQLKTPEQFLGYKIGTRYTPHWKVVSYFQYVTQSNPGTMKMLQYGETNEGRPLYLTFIANEENFKNLDQIRQNNLRLAGMSRDKMAASETGPVIVWLSYNVHGNETSSSEAALLTVYDLANPANAKTKEWLKNTVVIMDPCMNPDGRDRYVNWFNSVVGKQYNPRLDSREHREPWPGGRTNHYNFDLNRDWAWQTQVESQGRLAQYNQWLPQVHVDYHEQGVNSPYYFAPAAQPYHEILTKWQRDFQVSIGKNHAKYFDANGWLYFTKEVFDLFYPSYGDTYPLYNGGIGMTYEQAGGGAGGLGVETDEEDTLTLVDRVMHHYTTGLSTVEISSMNADKLIKEFHKFYSDALSGSVGDYKAYVIRNDPASPDRMASLVKLLDKNKIQYTAGSGSGRGVSYDNGKEEAFTIGAGDLVISSAQPKATLLKVLFEPQSKLVDSSTYDITAWSLPYVYGLKAFASKAAISGGAYTLPDSIKNPAADAYGYVARWQGVSAAKLAGKLLQAGVRLRYAEQPFEVSGQKFNAGSVIIIKRGNEKFGAGLWSLVAKAADAANVAITPITTGMVDKGYDFGSGYVHPMHAVKVVLLTGEGTNALAAGEVWHFMEKELEYPVTLINANDVGRANWSEIDVLIMPDGRYSFLNDKAVAAQFSQWITAGGHVIALENAVTQLSQQDWSDLKLRKDEEDDKKDKKEKDGKDPYADVKAFDNRNRADLPDYTPGAIFRVAVDNTHPLMFGYPDFYYSLKQDDKVYDFIKEGGWNVGVIRKETQLAGFVGYKLQKKLKDGLVFGVQDKGRGSVTYITDDIMFRNFWENGKLMFCNALFLVGH